MAILQSSAITGSLIVSGSSNNLVQLQGSGSTVLTVNGASGQLFGVSDDLTDSLFSVNTIAGLPVIEAFADNTVKIGTYGNEELIVSSSQVFITSASLSGPTLFLDGNVGILNTAPGEALTVGDGTADTSVAIKKSDNNVSDHLQFFNGTTRVGEIGTQDDTWLRINQVTSKNIYTPRYIRADGGFFVDSTSYGINGSGRLLSNSLSGTYSNNLTFSGNITVGGNLIVNNNVGIGESTPDFALQVATPEETTDPISFAFDITRENSGIRGMTFGMATNDTFGAIGTHNADLQLGHTFGTESNGQPAFYPTLTIQHIDQSVGNVGIGTTSPKEKLHVQGNITGSGNLTLEGNAGYPIFESGFGGSGWRVDSSANAEFQNLTVRGTFSVYELLAQQIRATNGSLLVATSGKVDTSTGGATGTLTFDTGNIYGHGFQQNDIILAQRLDSAGTSLKQTFLRVDTRVDSGSLTYTKLSGNDPEAGQEFVRIGNTTNTDRQGHIYLTADDSYAPFIGVRDGVDAYTDFTNGGYSIEKARLGRLEGITSPTFGPLDGYGLHTQNIYAEGNTQIAGTLTAGDANGFGTTFFAGRIKVNYLESSDLHGDIMSSEARWTITDSSTDVTNPIGGTTTTKGVYGTTGNTYFWRTCNGFGLVNGQQYTMSVWIRSASGTTPQIKWATNRGGEETFTVTEDWYRASYTFTYNSTYPESEYYVGFRGVTSNATFYFWGWQFEEGNEVTTYQPTDGTILSSDTGFGMWSIAGGFGGTIQNPVVSLNNYGLKINSSDSVHQSSLTNNSIQIGNVTGTANSAIKLTNTGTNSTSGLFGYTSAGNESFALKLDGTANIAGFNFTNTYIAKTKTSLGDANPGVYVGTDGISLGASSVFKVEDDGKLTATDATITGNITANTGTIGGFTISGDALSGTNFYLSGSATGNEFFISSSNFNVKANGDITASNASLIGGTIGDIEINGTAGSLTSGEAFIDTFSAAELDNNLWYNNSSNAGEQAVIVNGALRLENDNDSWDYGIVGKKSFSRSNSPVFVFHFKVLQAGGAISEPRIMIGVTDDIAADSYTDNVHSIYFASNSIVAYEGGSNRGTISSGTVATGDTFKVIMEPQTSGFDYTIYKNEDYTTPLVQGTIGSFTEATLYPSIQILPQSSTLEFYSIYAYDSSTPGGFDIKQGGSFGFVNNSGSEAIFSQGGFSLRSSNIDVTGNSLRLGDTLKFDGSNLIITGSINATSGNFTGTISAGDGDIGGFNIGTNTLTTTNFSIGDSTQTYALAAGASNQFTVTHAGALTATSATITGDITATNITATTAGNIAGWSIGANTLSSGDVYLSNVTNEKGLYIDGGSGPNRLQVGEFTTITPTTATLSQGTRTANDTGTKLYVNAVSPPSFGFDAAGSSADSGNIVIPITTTVNQGDTVNVSQPVVFDLLTSDGSITGITTFATVTVELLSGSAETVVASNSIQRSTIYASSKTLSLVYYHTNAGSLSSGDLKVKISYSSQYNRSTDPGNLREVYVGDTVLSKDSALVNITNNQALFYQGPNRQFEWTPSGITFKGGEVEIEALTGQGITLLDSGSIDLDAGSISIANGKLSAGGSAGQVLIAENDFVDPEGYKLFMDSDNSEMILMNKAFIGTISMIVDGGVGQPEFAIRRTTSNTEVFRIDNNGNVGIGGVDPGNLLHVAGSNNSTPVRFEIGSNANYYFQANSTSGYATTFNMDDTGLDIGHNSSGRSLNLQTDSQDRLTILGGGNVGIGTTAPDYKLDVAGDIGVDEYIYHNGDTNTYIRFQPDDISFTVGGQNIFRADYNTSLQPVEVVVNEAGVPISFRVESDTVNHALFVTGSTGYIGVHTSSPSSKFTVSNSTGGAESWPGGILVENTSTSTGEAAVAFSNAGTSGTGANQWIIGVNQSANFDIAYGTQFTNGNTAIRVGTNKNVGIGGVFTSARLDIVQSADTAGGGIRIRESDDTADWWDIFLGGADRLYFYYTGTSNGGYIDDATAATQMNFTGQHRSNISPTQDNITEITDSERVGLIVSADGTYSNIDGGTEPTINDSIPNITLSVTAKDKKVFGVISDQEDLTDGVRTFSQGNFVSTYEVSGSEAGRTFVNSLGEGGIWVSNYSGSFENGDYITTSPIPGIGMKQDDDLLHNYTVGKITQDCNFDDATKYIEVEFSGSTYRKQFVGCTYHCG